MTWRLSASLPPSSARPYPLAVTARTYGKIKKWLSPLLPSWLGSSRKGTYLVTNGDHQWGSPPMGRRADAVGDHVQIPGWALPWLSLTAGFGRHADGKARQNRRHEPALNDHPERMAA